MRRTRAPRLAFGLLLLSLTFAAQAEGGPDFSQALVTALDAPVRSLFPLTTPDVTAHPVTNLIFESLLERDAKTGELVPLLARSYTVDKDKAAITFKLDPAARFADGTPVTADDVKFSYDLLEMDGIDSEPWLTHFLFVQGVTVKAPDTVVFQLERANYTYLVALAEMRIFPKKYYAALYEKDHSLRKPESVLQPLGSGAWKLASIDDTLVVLERNENYWNRAAFEKNGRWTYGKRAFRILQGREAQLSALKSGAIDYLPLTKEEWAGEVLSKSWPKDVKAVQAETKIPGNYDCIAWNHRHPALASSAVRWAMSHLVDLRDWSDKLDRGLTVAAIGPYSPKGDFHDPSLKAVPFSLSKAKFRLDAEGWKERDADGYRVRGGKRLSVRILYPATGPGSYGPKIYSMVEAGKKVGVEIIPVASSWDEIRQAVEKRAFDGVVMTWTRTPGASLRRIFYKDQVKDGDNFVDYRNETVSKLIDQMDAEFDAKKRVELGRQIQAQIYLNQVYTFLTEYKYTLYARNRRIEAPFASLPHQIGLAWWRIKAR